MIKVGIIGGAGYTAGELLRILLHHPQVQIDFVYSTSNAGNPLYKVHNDLLGETDMLFTATINPNVEVLFLCTAHGNSGEFLANNKFNTTTKIIDLSNEFRLQSNSNFLDRNFIYGLPESQHTAIENAQNIANPGCFATAIQLALLPLFANQLILENEAVHIHAITGSTGAGQSLSPSTHFSWRSGNISTYKVFNHQHLDEINQTLRRLNPNYKGTLHFIPIRGDFPRGIFATAYTKTTNDLATIKDCYQSFYQSHPFTIISENNIHLKQVLGTNKCLLHIEKHQDTVIITAIIDNLLKGASGQAVQNMNILFNLPENTGLNLKSIAF